MIPPDYIPAGPTGAKPTSHAAPFTSGVLWLATVVLVATTIWAYSNTWHVPLLFDDEVSIRDNPSIRNLHDIGAVLFAPPAVFSAGRPFLNLSFALNYAVGGTAVVGYHLVNLAIHVLAGLTFLGVVRRTLRLQLIPAQLREMADACAIVGAAMWLLHPVATNAVTYLSQRAESLMALMYLLTLYCFVRSVDSPASRWWRLLAIVTCLVGVGVKEVIVTAPIVVLLYDRAFVAGTLRGALQKSRWFYAGLFGTWPILGALMLGSHIGARGIGLGQGVNGWHYALVESRALLHYAQLAAWPWPLIFDYGENPFGGSAASHAPFVVIWLVIAAVVGVTAVRRPILGFLPVGILMMLLPTSSIVPIAAQPVAESRMYLPLALAIAGMAVVVFRVVGRIAIVPLAGVGLTWGSVTHARNADFTTSTSIWHDTVIKVPDSARAHGNLGLVLARDTASRESAKRELQQALRLKRNYPEAEYNLANLLQQDGNAIDAIEHYRRAIALKPRYEAAHANLGWLLAQQPGQSDGAMAELRMALAIDGSDIEAQYTLANLLSATSAGRDEAMRLYRVVIAARPTAAEPHNNLAIVLARSGDLTTAAAELRRALELNPDYAEARRNLAIIERAADRRGAP